MGAVFAVTLIFIQLLSLLHLLIHHHTINAWTGKVVHVATCTASAPESDQPHDETDGEECQVLALLVKPTTVDLPFDGAAAFHGVVTDLTPEALFTSVSQQGELFLLAPSHSPPGAAPYCG